MKTYCTQNNGDCTTCSLVNYGLDCTNHQLTGDALEDRGNNAEELVSLINLCREALDRIEAHSETILEDIPSHERIIKALEALNGSRLVPII